MSAACFNANRYINPYFYYICKIMDTRVKETLIEWAEEYNDPKYFQEDPIIFPTQFARKLEAGQASLADVEIAALLYKGNCSERG